MGLLQGSRDQGALALCRGPLHGGAQPGDERFELAAPAPLNLVCFRLKSGDAANQALMERLNRSGDIFLTHTRLNDRFTLRFCVGQTNTQRRHVERAWKRIQQEAGSR